MTDNLNIQDYLNCADHFAANAGCRITEVDAKHAVAVMTVTDAHLNGGHVCPCSHLQILLLQPS